MAKGRTVAAVSDAHSELAHLLSKGANRRKAGQRARVRAARDGVPCMQCGWHAWHLWSDPPSGLENGQEFFGCDNCGGTFLLTPDKAAEIRLRVAQCFA